MEIEMLKTMGQQEAKTFAEDLERTDHSTFLAVKGSASSVVWRQPKGSSVETLWPLFEDSLKKALAGEVTNLVILAGYAVLNEEIAERASGVVSPLKKASSKN